MVLEQVASPDMGAALSALIVSGAVSLYVPPVLFAVIGLGSYFMMVSSPF